MKSWKTAATRSRHEVRSISRRSTPSISIAPDCGSYSRHSSFASVVLPAPFCPTMARDEPVRGDDEQHAPHDRTLAQAGGRVLQIVQARAAFAETLDRPGREAE